MVDIQNSVSEFTNTTDRYVIAISGGVDSAVLTHIFYQLKLTLEQYSLIITKEDLKNLNNQLKLYPIF